MFTYTRDHAAATCGSGVAGRDRQNTWNPRKNCGCFVDVVGTLTNKANISIQYYLGLIAFPPTPKHVTLNDLKWPFLR